MGTGAAAPPGHPVLRPVAFRVKLQLFPKLRQQFRQLMNTGWNPERLQKLEGQPGVAAGSVIRRLIGQLLDLLEQPFNVAAVQTGGDIPHPQSAFRQKRFQQFSDNHHRNLPAAAFSRQKLILHLRLHQENFALFQLIRPPPLPHQQRSLLHIFDRQKGSATPHIMGLPQQIDFTDAIDPQQVIRNTGG